MKFIKRLISFIMCLLLMVMALPLEMVSAETEDVIETVDNINILGDANEDSKVNVKDATAIQKYVASIISFDDSQIMKSDANEDGRVNVKDATAIQKYIAGIELDCSIGAQILLDDSVSGSVEYNSFMEGFTDIRITDEESAIKAVDSVSDILGITDAEKELEVVSVNNVDGDSFYRIQQYYNDIPVYGSNIVISANEQGEATAMTANVADLEGVDLKLKLSEDDILYVIGNMFEGDYIASTPTLVVYNELNSSNDFCLAYRVNVFSKNKSIEYFLSADDGEVLDSFEIVFYERVTASGDDNKKQSRNFYCEKVKDDLYFLADFEKNISVYDAGNKDVFLTPNERYDGFEVHWKNVWYNMDSWFTSAEVVQNKKNEWNDEEAVTLMANLNDVYDYYDNYFGIKGFNNANGEVFAIINDNIDGDRTNAYSVSSVGINETIISTGVDNAINLDTVAHEYTHSVIGYNISLRNGESGAINEAYADIMGELIENDSTWTHGRRTIASPLDNSYPSFYKGENWVDATDVSEANDRGGVHKNSTVISHAAYLMWNGIDGTENRKIDSVTLSKLWYKSILLMQSNANFSQCRNAVELSARIMLNNEQITEEQYKTVIRAFEEVGIDNAVFSATETVTNDFDLSVLSSEGTENVHFKLEVIKMPIIKAGPGVVNEQPKLVQEIAAITGHQSLSLKDGTYVLRISEINDDRNISKAINIKLIVDGDNDKAVNKVVVNTDFTDVIVVGIDDSGDADKHPGNNFIEDAVSKYGLSSEEQFVSCVGSDIQIYPESIYGVLSMTWLDMDNDNNEELVVVRVAKSDDGSEAQIVCEVFSEEKGEYSCTASSEICTLSYNIASYIYLYYSNELKSYCLVTDSSYTGAYTGVDSSTAQVFTIAKNSVCEYANWSVVPSFGISTDFGVEFSKTGVPFAKNCTIYDKTSETVYYQPLCEVKHEVYGDAYVYSDRTHKLCVSAFSEDNIVGNGTNAVGCDDGTYYWTYSESNVNPEYTLMFENNNGDIKELYKGATRGEIYLLDDTLTINQHLYGPETSYTPQYSVVVLSAEGELIKEIPDFLVEDIDESKDYYVLRNYYHTDLYDTSYYIYSIDDSSFAPAPWSDEDVRFVNVNNGIVYYYVNTDDARGVILYSYDVENKRSEELSTSYIEYYDSGPGYGSSPCTIYHLQETENTIYYSCVYTAGSGNYIQRAKLFMYDKVNGQNIELTDDIYEIGADFYVYIENGVEKVICYNDNLNSNVIISDKGNSIETTDKYVQLIRKPYREDGTGVDVPHYLYLDDSGDNIQILPATSVDNADDYVIVYIENVCYTGEYTFYDINYHKLNPTPSSWRDHSITDKLETYRYNINTGETDLICSMKYE